ncbi:MAG: DUF6521 family protein [Nocardioidaceae bacterium]|nr:DUF6521 family protein [Nocardioidaceae bacterium]
MTAWRFRSRAQAAMLNPALLAAITAAAASEYKRATGEPMPWPLAYLIAPLVLHRSTRESLPRTTRTHLGNWVSQNPVIHAGLSARAQSLAEPVREGLRFGLRHGALEVDDRGRLTGDLVAPAKKAAPGEAGQIIAKAGLVGKWLAKIDHPATVFAVMGVAP